MSAREPYIDIIDSDGQFDLFAQLFDLGRNFRKRKTFRVVLKNASTGEEVKAQAYITGINERPGSDTSFDINGTIADKGMKASTLLLWEKPDSWFNRLEKFEAHLDTRTRRGEIWQKKL